MGNSGWTSRGYLPHFDSPEKIQLITFHLADSLPKHALEQMSWKLSELPEDQRIAEKQRRLQKWLDAGLGACHLRNPDVAQIVQDALLANDGINYRLFEWIIMPNHVHVIVEFAAHAEMHKVVKAWKGASAALSNRVLSRSGAFWMPDYHDRYMRDENHFRSAVAYVLDNPVRAGLCTSPEAWPFGSARLRIAAELLEQ